MILFVGTNVGFPQKQGRRYAVQQMPPKREVKAQLNGGWIRWTQIWPAADCLTVR